MKSEHRHDLKTNELAEWLINFPQWARKNRTVIIYVSIVAIFAAVAFYWKRHQTKVIIPREQIDFTNAITPLPQNKMQIVQAQLQGFDTSYNLITFSKNLRAIAQNTKNDTIAALAFIKSAHILRTELHYRLETVSEQDVKTQIDEAKVYYNNAIEKSSANPSLTAMAKLGLGLCEEELANFAGAEQIYRDITENPLFESTVAAAQAKQRLDTMADYQKKITFRPSPVPQVPPIQISTITPTDINLPNSPNQ